MSIGIAGSQAALATSLKAQGLSGGKAQLVESDLAASIAKASPMGVKADAAVRTALNQRMSADVASGKLSRKDADAVNRTLDGMAQGDGSVAAATPSADGQAATATASGGTAARGSGGGGGGSAEKTELSRSMVVTGALETITITYTDNTTKIETKATGADASAEPDSYAASDRMPAGVLIDQTA